MTKREIIDKIEATVKELKELKKEEFIPYPQSFKEALERESEKTLMSDLTLVQKQLALVRSKI